MKFLNFNFMERIATVEELRQRRESYRERLELRERSNDPERVVRIRVGLDDCGIAAGARETARYFRREVERRGLEALVVPVGCMGFCDREPTVEVILPGREPVVFGSVGLPEAERILEDYLGHGTLPETVLCLPRRFFFPGAPEGPGDDDSGREGGEG